MIKVGIASPTFLCGGAERWCLNTAKYLDKSRIEYAGLFLVHSSSFGPLLEEAKRLGPIYSVTKDTDALKNCDVLLYWANSHPEYELVKKRICVLHNVTKYAYQFGMEGLKKDELIVATSKRMAKMFADSENVIAVHNGVDLKRIIPTIPKGQIRKQLKIGEGKLIIGSMGRCAPEKGLERIAAAAKVLGPEVIPCFIGPIYDRRIQKKIQATNPQSRFIDAKEDIGNYLQIFDCFVQSSYIEGNSLMLLEAMAAGVPIVSTPTGAIPEFFEMYGELCVTVPLYADTATLAGGILQAMASDNLLRRSAAKNVVHTMYSQETIGKQWSDICCDYAEGRVVSHPDYSFPGVSIITAAYNTPARYLNELWDSIKNQSYSKWEWIIVDDGSESDETKSALARIGKLDSRIKILTNEQNQHSAKARNRAIRESKYELVTNIDSDDIMERNRLSCQVAWMVAEPKVTVLGAQMRAFDDGLYVPQEFQTLPIQITKQEYKKNPDAFFWLVHNPTVMFRKSTILSLGGYDEEFSYMEDAALWLKVLKNNLLIQNLPYVTTFYRAHENQKTVNICKPGNPELKKLQAKLQKLKETILKSP